MKKRRLEDILDECLENILKGENIEDCLSAYPEQASELEPLLKTSLALRQRSSAIQPRPEFRVKAHSRLQAEFRRSREKVRIPIWHKKWAVAAVTVLVMLFCGVGTTVASTNALPDEPLYSVKLATEQVRLTLAFSDVDKTRLHIYFAERRAAEIVDMASQGESEQIPELVERLNKHLRQVSCEVEEIQESRRVTLGPSDKPKPGAFLIPGTSNVAEGDIAELKGLLGNSTLKSDLESVLDKVPPSVKLGLRQAIRNYDEILLKLEDN
mgnify:CR=1 FL=1